MYKVISFYRYCIIQTPEQLRERLHIECTSKHILGRILVAKEGINGAVCGKSEDMELFKRFVQLDFPALTFREQKVTFQTYHKLVVKVREEIVRFGSPVNVDNAATYISPSELNQLYQQNQDFIIVDARNDYEYEVGHFKGAVKMPIRNFRDFAKNTETLGQYKDKKMILYCTGGIRCEKASAYLNEQGFKDVSHVQGGIINYLNHDPQYWEGELFVFDDRLVSEGQEIISVCALCDAPSKKYINCHNLECDKLFISCSDCENNMNSTCSKECKNNSRQRQKVKKVHQHTIIGRVKHYFAKNKVAVVTVQSPLTVGQEIAFIGKTTAEFKQKIIELRSDEQNIISLPVMQKVRKNDAMIICTI